MTTITLPAFISFKNWADDLNRSLPRFQIPIVTPSMSWWEWADSLIQLNAISNISIPDRTLYPNEEDWKKWAYTFIQSVA